MLPPFRHRAYRHLFSAQIAVLTGTGLARVTLLESHG
jgi:hypothetical protein